MSDFNEHNTGQPETDKQTGKTSLVFVGLMGVGKSSVGRKVAHLLGLEFADADLEIEAAAGRSIPEIFRDFGEPAFREGERKVIKRLLNEKTLVLATGGGAFMDESTRDEIKATAVSIWLNADIGVLVDRVERNDSRPLLAGGNAGQKLTDLSAVRNPVYALADIHLNTNGFNLNESANAVLKALSANGYDFTNDNKDNP